MVHPPAAGRRAGFVGGALWGVIPGFLKARTGAHEVIITIMLNYIAFRLIDCPLRTPPSSARADPTRSRSVQPTAALVPIFTGPARALGHLIALVAAVVVSWLLFRSTLGFEFRAVGANPAPPAMPA